MSTEVKATITRSLRSRKKRPRYDETFKDDNSYCKEAPKSTMVDKEVQCDLIKVVYLNNRLYLELNTSSNDDANVLNQSNLSENVFNSHRNKTLEVENSNVKMEICDNESEIPFDYGDECDPNSIVEEDYLIKNESIRTIELNCSKEDSDSISSVDDDNLFKPIVNKLPYKKTITGKYECIKCSRVCRTANHIKRHLETHNEKCLVCQYCGEGFKLARELKSHEKRQACLQVDYEKRKRHKIKTITEIEKETVEATSKTGLACSKCTKKYKQIRNLRKHYVEDHWWNDSIGPGCIRLRSI